MLAAAAPACHDDASNELAKLAELAASDPWKVKEALAVAAHSTNGFTRLLLASAIDAVPS